MSWTRKYPQPSIFLWQNVIVFFFFFTIFRLGYICRIFQGKEHSFFSSKTKKQTLYDSINTYERGFLAFFIYILLMLQNLGLLSLCRLLWSRDLLDFLFPLSPSDGDFLNLSLFDGSRGGRSGGCGPFSASGGGFSCRPSVDGRVMIGKLSVHAAKEKGKIVRLQSIFSFSQLKR